MHISLSPEPFYAARSLSSSTCAFSSSEDSSEANSPSPPDSSMDDWDPACVDEEDGDYVPTKRRGLRSAGSSAHARRRTSSASSVAMLPDEPLMKKTRGRRVPTKDEVLAAGLSQVRRPRLRSYAVVVSDVCR